jgi:hypothetical protein
MVGTAVKDNFSPEYSVTWKNGLDGAVDWDVVSGICADGWDRNRASVSAPPHRADYGLTEGPHNLPGRETKEDLAVLGVKGAVENEHPGSMPDESMASRYNGVALRDGNRLGDRNHGPEYNSGRRIAGQTKKKPFFGFRAVCGQ